MKKILLISTNALGDTYLTCAAFNSIKSFFKKSQIDIISSSDAKFLLDEVGFDNVFLIKKKSFAEMHKIMSKVRNTKYDYAFNFFPGQMNTSLFKLSSAVEKIGFTNYIRKKDWHNEEDILRIKSQPKQKNYVWKPGDNYLDRIRLALEAAEIKHDIKKHVFEYKLNTDNKFDVVMHLFSSDNSRKINSESVKKIITELCEHRNKHVCILGSKDEINELGELKQNKNLQIEVSPDLKKLINVINNSELYIGVDSFPLHIADAYNKKIAGIFYYKNEKSVFQDMNNKYIFRVSDNDLSAAELTNFIKEKKLLDGI